MKTTKDRIDKLKEIIRKPYTWPGGYEKIAIMSNGEVICHKCCKENYKEILHDTKHDWNTDYNLKRLNILEIYEEEPIYCDQCSKQLGENS